jgi:F420-dependent methylenetetrahydromethanopterin dehydrogenase
MTTPEELAHRQKIQAAKRNLETKEGKEIDYTKIQEWAMLEIAEQLAAINVKLGYIMGNIEKAVGKMQ